MVAVNGIEITDVPIAVMQQWLGEEVNEDIQSDAKKNLRKRFKRSVTWPAEAAAFSTYLENLRHLETTGCDGPNDGKHMGDCSHLETPRRVVSNDDGLTEACEVFFTPCGNLAIADALQEAAPPFVQGIELSVDDMKVLLMMLVPQPFQGSIADLKTEAWDDMCEREVQVAFEQRFGHLARMELESLMQNPSHVPQGMVPIHTLVAQFDEDIRLQMLQMETALQLGKAKRRQATLATSQFLRRCYGEVMPILDSIANLLGQKATQLAHEGSSTYAEPTQTGLLKIAGAMKPLLGNNLDGHVLLDCGAGVGTALWTLCQALGIKGLGIEYAEKRVFTGSHYTSAMLKAFKGNEALQYKVVNMHGDLLHLQSVPSCVTVAYQFDEAFPPRLMKKMLQLYLHAPLTLRFIIATKTKKDSQYVAMFAKYGLYPLQPTIACVKAGSQESSHFTIYGRRCCDYSDLKDKVLAPPTVEATPDDEGEQTHTTEAADETTEVPCGDPTSTHGSLSPEVEQVLNGDLDATLRYYVDLELQMRALMSVKRSTKGRDKGGCDQGRCTAAASLEHCGDSTCGVCEAAFRHADINTLYDAYVQWLPCQKGLFTSKPLPSEAYVVQYVGKPCANVVAGKRYTLKLSASKIIDAEGVGRHQFVNHSCQPNCRFTKWLNIQKELCVSIVTLRGINAQEELTVDYGTSREPFNCKCPSCTPYDRTVLLLGMTNLSDDSILQTTHSKPPLTVPKMIKGMLRTKQVGQQLRDSLRIRALEQQGWRTVTLSLENGDGFAASHLNVSWNGNSLPKELKKLNIVFDVIELDYFWMPQAYVADKMTAQFFRTQLPALAEFVSVGGSMLLPAQISLIKHLMATKANWSPLYELRLLDADTRAQISPLCAAYQTLQKMVGKTRLDTALAKNETENMLLNSTLSYEQLQHASVASEMLMRDQTLPICLLQLVRRDRHGTEIYGKRRPIGEVASSPNRRQRRRERS